MQSEERRYLKEGRYSISESDILGQGSFGRVYRGYDHVGSKWMALKEISLDKISSEFGQELKAIILSEISIMRKFSRKMKESPCDFLVCQEDCFRTDKAIFIVMEICPHGTLEDEMRARKLTQPECQHVLYCLSMGLAYMSEMGVVHRDLKPENVFVSTTTIGGVQQKVYKIGDFGFASQKQEHEIAMGTIPYMAPEMFAKGKYSNAVDIWSLGVIGFQILFNKLYFDGKDRWEIQANIKQKEFVPTEGQRAKMSPQYFDFLSRCLKKDPGTRIKASQLPSHPLFDEVKASIDLARLQESYEKQLRESGSYEQNKAKLDSTSSETRQISLSHSVSAGEKSSSQPTSQPSVFKALEMLMFECVRLREMAEQFSQLSIEEGRQTEFVQMYLLKDAYVMMNKITYTAMHQLDYTEVLNGEQVQELKDGGNADELALITSLCTRECNHIGDLFNAKYVWFTQHYIPRFSVSDQELIRKVVNEQPYEFCHEQVVEKEIKKWVYALEGEDRWGSLGRECRSLALAKGIDL